MQNYKVGNKAHVLESTDFEHLLPKGWVKITQAQADALNVPVPETPSQAEARKDAQVAAEFSNIPLTLIAELVDSIKDGSITTKTPDQILINAMGKRKLEL